MKVPSIFIIGTGIIAAIARGCFELLNKGEQKDEAILIIMALINCIALGFVFLILFNDLMKICETKIQGAGLLSKEKAGTKLYLKIMFSIPLILYVICGGLYVCKWKSVCANDIMAVIALSVSIANDRLAEELAEPMYIIARKIYNIRTR